MNPELGWRQETNDLDIGRPIIVPTLTIDPEYQAVCRPPLRPADAVLYQILTRSSGGRYSASASLTSNAS